MLSGAHVLLFSPSADADAAFLRDVLALPHVDAGDHFLIFGLPPAEMAVHGTEPGGSARTELYLIVDSIAEFTVAMQEHGVPHEPIADRGWGLASSITLPSGTKLGVYEARHARPPTAKKAKKAAKKAKKAEKKAKKAVKAEKKAAKKAEKKAAKKAEKKAEKKAAKAAKKSARSSAEP